MNKKIKQIGLRLLAAILLTAAISFQSLAATARIAFSDPTTQVGQEVSVTMKFTSTSGDMLGDTDVMLAYDTSALEFISGSGNVSGGTGAIRVKSAPAGATEAVTELKFKALKAGTTTISISSWEGYDNNGQSLTVEREGTSTVTIQGLETSSADATLKSLQVSPGTLTPAFTPTQETYTVEVGLDVDKLTVSAEANNDHAIVTVEGGTELAEGQNTVVCKVTAEDGTTVKNYTLTVNKSAAGGAAGNGENGEPDESSAQQPEVLAELDVTAKKIRVTALPDGVEVPKGFKSSTIVIGDVKVPGWTWEADESPRYCVFYGMNENGDQDFYRYDISEKTIQRYFADQGASSFTDEEYTALAEDYNSLVDDFRLIRMIMFAAVAVAVILLIALIVVARASSKKPGGGGKNDYDDRSREVRGRSEAQTARTAGGRKLSKEELYMMGEEEDYDEDYEEEDGYENVRTTVPAEQAGAVEREIARNLAKEAAVTADIPEEEDGDDFEFFDLDE